jgi:hypothetical protein
MATATGSNAPPLNAPPIDSEHFSPYRSDGKLVGSALRLQDSDRISTDSFAL